MGCCFICLFFVWRLPVSQVEGSEGSSHISRGLSLVNGDQDHSKYEMLHHLGKDAETDQVHKSLVGGKGEEASIRSGVASQPASQLASWRRLMA